MCLFFKTKKKVRTAKEDIVCYKLVEKKGGRLLTIYQGFPIAIGATYEIKDEEPFPCFKKRIISNGFKYFISEYAFHSYVKQKDAVKAYEEWIIWEEDRVKEMYERAKREFHIVKCVIPKGAHYLIGDYDRMGIDSYASDEIKYVEMIK